MRQTLHSVAGGPLEKELARCGVQRVELPKHERDMNSKLGMRERVPGPLDTNAAAAAQVVLAILCPVPAAAVA